MCKNCLESSVASLEAWQGHRLLHLRVKLFFFMTFFKYFFADAATGDAKKEATTGAGTATTPPKKAPEPALDWSAKQRTINEDLIFIRKILCTVDSILMIIIFMFSLSLFAALTFFVHFDIITVCSIIANSKLFMLKNDFYLLKIYTN